MHIFIFRRIHILFIVLKSNTLKDCQDSSIFRPQLTVVLTAPFWINRYLQKQRIFMVFEIFISTEK